MGTDAQDAAAYRALVKELGELMEDGEAAHTSGLCAMYLAARAHAINADKAEFKLEGLVNAEGKKIGNWVVTLKEQGKRKRTAKGKAAQEQGVTPVFIEQMDSLYDDFRKYSNGDPKVPFIVLRENLVSTLNEYESIRQTLVAFLKIVV